MSDSSRGSSEGRHYTWVCEVLVVSEVALALVLTRVLASLLFGVEPTDPITFLPATGVTVARPTVDGGHKTISDHTQVSFLEDSIFKRSFSPISCNMLSMCTLHGKLRVGMDRAL